MVVVLVEGEVESTLIIAGIGMVVVGAVVVVNASVAGKVTTVEMQ